jgi:hypothetical protein
VWSDSVCFVVELPSSKFELQVASKRSSLVCRSSVVGEHFHATAHVNIVQVAWHPRSPTHLMVLTSDQRLAMYNVAYNVDEPELSLDLRLDRTRDPITSFCFGADADSWETFTVYACSDEGHIFTLCPIVPQGSAIIESTLTKMSQLASDVLADSGDGNPESAWASMALTWLRHTFREPAESSAQQQQQQQPTQTLYNASPPRNQRFRPCMQGPLTIHPKPDDADISDPWLPEERARYTSITALDTKGTAVCLARICMSGSVDIIMGMSPVQPSFRTDDALLVTLPRGDPYLLFERVYLGAIHQPVLEAHDRPDYEFVSDSTGTDAGTATTSIVWRDQLFSPILIADSTHANLMYSFSPAGVILIEIDWLPAWIRMCTPVAAQPSAEELESFVTNAHSSLLQLTSFQRHDRPCACVVVSDPMLDHIAIVFERDFRACALDLNVQRLPPLMMKPQAFSTDDVSDEKHADWTDAIATGDGTGDSTGTAVPIEPFERQCGPLLESLEQRISSRVLKADRNISLQNPGHLIAFNKNVKMPFDQMYMDIEKLSTMMQKRTGFLGDMAKTQQAEFESLETKFADALQRSQVLKQKLAVVQKTQTLLNEAVEGIIAAKLRTRNKLSAAERQFHNMLLHKKEQLQMYRKDIDALQRQGARLQADKERLYRHNSARSSGMSDAQAVKLQGALAEHNSLIGACVADAKRIRSKIGHSMSVIRGSD